MSVEVFVSCGNWKCLGENDRLRTISGCHDWQYVEGVVVDKHNSPINDVKVSMSGHVVTTTDSAGQFYIPRVRMINLKENNKVDISFSKSGYKNTYKSYSIRNGGKHIIRLRLNDEENGYNT